MTEEIEQVETEELEREAAARRALALAQIRQYPDPVLRLQAREIDEFDDELVRLAARMKRLMVDANGVGLAATQIGILRRLFVFQPPDEEDARTLVNPEIVERSEELVGDDEGCLSMQGIVVPVERNVTVTIAGRDERGEDVRLDLAEPAARIVQHELDHLDGVLIIDRTEPESRREALALLRPRPLLGAS